MIGRALFIVAALIASVASAQPARRYVAAGWDLGNSTIPQLARMADRFATLPLDGVRISLRATNERGEPVGGPGPTSALDGDEWAWDLFDNQLDAARAITGQPNMKHCFLGVRGAPNRRLDWRDDEAWRKVAHNFAVIARFAKKTGFRGMIPDFEDYLHVYQYRLQNGDPDWTETARLARRRGREIFGAVFAEYPDITLFFWHFLNPWMRDFETCENVGMLRRESQNLFYDVLDGLYDVLPPSARIVACEEQLYDRRVQEHGFFRGYALERRLNADLLSPENRARFAAQTSLGFDLYLDAFSDHGPSSPYYRGEEGYPSRLGCLFANREEASKASDEYVWFWGEKHPWVNWGHRDIYRTNTTWEATMPGLSEGLRRIKDPVRYAVSKLREFRAGGASNLVANAACSARDGYILWQQRADRNGSADGTLDVDPAEGCRAAGSIVMTGVKGSATVHIRGLRPGERYVAAVRVKAEGDAAVSAAIAWTKDRKWDFGLTRRRLEAAGGNGKGWTLLVAVCTVPEGADGLGLNVGSTARPGQRVWFDDVEIYRLP